MSGATRMTLGLLPAAALACSMAAPGASTYYVDYARGSDTAAGTLAAPWQHAPGDPAATGRAARTALRAGDTVIFAAGVPYRGTIEVSASGTADRPITFTGEGFGTGQGVIDGSDPAEVARCPSADACGGAADWAALSLVRFPGSAAAPQLFGPDGVLWEAQLPIPRDRFYGDDVAGWRATSPDEGAAIVGGRLTAPDWARAMAGRPAGAILVWVRGNEVKRRPVTGVAGDTLLFDGTGLMPYTDRPGRVALVGAPGAPLAPGTYVMLRPGVAVANLGGRSGVSVGANRGGFLLRGAAHVTIRGLQFRNQSSEGRAVGQGVAIEARGAGSADLKIIGNRFGPSVMRNHQGAIRLTDVAGVTVSGNSFTDLVDASGLRTGANNRDLVVSGNRFTRVGRTAIAVFGASGGRIEGNVITDARGLHGNGLSLYLTNRNIAVVDNRITDTTRPMTFHGDKIPAAPPGDHNFVIERNLFLATDDSQAALTSWGAATRGVTIRQNVLGARKLGALLHASDSRVVVEGNVWNGHAVARGEPGPDWRIGGNDQRPWPELRGVDVAKGCRLLRLPAGTAFGAGSC